MTFRRGLRLGLFLFLACCAGAESRAAAPLDLIRIDTAPAGSPPLLSAGSGVTAIAGRVLSAADQQPLVGVEVKDGLARAETDTSGRFLLQDVTPGPSVMVIDGRRAHAAHDDGPADFGYYEVSVAAKLNATTSLPFVDWLTRIDHRHDVAIASPIPEAVTVTTPAVPGLELRLPAGAVITGPDGKPVTKIGLTPISPRRPPFPLPRNVDVPIYFTAQPGGSVISSADGSWLGAQVVYPNYWHQLQRAQQIFWTYLPDQGGWLPYGTGVVTNDRTQVVPTPSTRIYALTGAMQQGPQSPPGAPPQNSPPPPVPGGSPAPGDPVDASSGAFTNTHTDMKVQDVVPISVARSYSSGSTTLRSFGAGMGSNYEMNLYSSDEYSTVSLVLPNGASVPYTRLPSSLTPTCGNSCYTGAVYTTTAAGPYFNSTITYNAVYNNNGGYYGTGWTLALSNGSKLIFGENAPLQAIQDRFGNQVTLVRSQGQLGNIIQVNSPNGRYIKFAYMDSTNPALVTSATDDIGRTFLYTYQPDPGCNCSTDTELAKIQDPDKGITTYVWQNGQVLSIQDPRLKTFVTNQYGTDLRVHQQTLADGTSTYSFTYNVGTNCTEVNGVNECNVLQANITDPNQNVELITFDSSQMSLTDTRAYGTAIQQEVASCRYGEGSANPTICASSAVTGGPAGYISDRVDGIGRDAQHTLERDTHYTYDNYGDILTVTFLYGSTNASPCTTTACTYQFAYSPTYDLLTATTDPLSHTTTITRPEPLEEATKITDALSNVFSFAYNAQGQVIKLTDAMSPADVTNYTYDHGSLISVKDPLSRVTNYFADAIGRRSRSATPLGEIWQTVYDSIDGVSGSTDADGASTSISFDADGNVQSVTDALTNKTSYAYTARDQKSTRIDPLLYQDQFTTYDPNGNLTVWIDRKGQQASYTYDALNRISTATYADGSVVTYTWDPDNRLTQIADTVGNTISRFYDGLNDLLCETPNNVGTLSACQSAGIGTLTYSYDAASRRKTMQASGQSQVSYTYDNDNRLTKIVQGSAVVQKTYDKDSRPATVTYTNGIVGTYGYDYASELTSIVYTLSSNTVGTLYYTYDNSSRISSRSGTLFQPVPPSAIAGAAYDADNRLCVWNVSPASCSSPPITWDKNGNLTYYGGASFTWDARNRLTAVSGLNLAFTYDALGRRLTQTLSGTTTSYIYDFQNVVQELQNGAASANLLTGLGVDERFQRTPVGSTASTFLTDNLGSILSLTDTTGTVQTNYAYTPYGATTVSGAATTNSYGFTGREYAAQDLYYYRARYYYADWGRFISQDPLGLSGGINKYAYVGDNPIGLTDPSGKFDGDPASWETAAAVVVSSGYATAAAIGAGVAGVACIALCPTPMSDGTVSSQTDTTTTDLASTDIPSAQVSVDGGNDIPPNTPPLGPSPSDSSGGDDGGGGGGDDDPDPNTVCCFMAGTLVATDSGLMPIEQLKVGQLVLSRNSADRRTAYKPVKALISPHRREIYEVKLVANDPEGKTHEETFRTTSDHPWRVLEEGWTRTEDLKPGMLLIRARGYPDTVASVLRTGVFAPTYNIEVAEFHSYFVGHDGVWVHNACAPLSPNQMNRAVERGQAPRGVGRTDVGKVTGEQQHTIIEGRGALNKDGTWKHGGGSIPKAIAGWLRDQGYNIP